MKLSLPVRLLYIAAVALVLADLDWAAKAWALDQLRPDQLVLNTDRPWHAVLTPPVLAVILVACARTRLLALGAGVIIGGALGNMGEFAVFGRVTDFIPLGLPYRGAVWSPADFFLAGGLLVLWAGAVRARDQEPMPIPGNHGMSTMPITATTVPATTEASAAMTRPAAITESAAMKRAPLDMEA